MRITPRRRFADDPLLNAEVLKMAKAVFSQRRKKIGNAMVHLDRGIGIGKAGVQAVLAEAGVDPGTRSDALSPEAIESLTRAILRHKGR